MYKYYLLRIFGIVALVSSFIKYTDCQLSHNENHKKIIPRDIIDAIALFEERKTFMKNLENHFHQVNYDMLSETHNVWYYLKKLFDKLDSIELINVNLPNITQTCLIQISAFVESYKAKQEWPLKLIDSFGKPTSGILQGSHLFLGEYSECVNISVPTLRFQGKYCLVTSPRSVIFAIGICVPRQCNNDDIATLYNFAIRNIPENITGILPFTLNPTDADDIECQEKPGLDKPAIIAIVVLSTLALIVFIATLNDLFQEYIKFTKLKAISDSNAVIIEGNIQKPIDLNQKLELIRREHDEAQPYIFKVLQSFSFYQNAKKVFRVNKTDDQLKCLHAIRFLSLSWVILGHTYAFGLSLTDNIVVQYSWVQRYSFLIVTNAYFAVDTFFLLSGLLTCYIFLKETDKLPQKFSLKFLGKYYLHRYWRLTPSYMILLMFLVTLTRYLGSGPVYPAQGFEINMCKDTWWLNLLYVNNLFKVDKMCYGVTWFLANDMQFHWIAPIILIPFALNKKRIAFILSALLLCGSILSIGLILNDHPGTEKGGFGPKGDLYRKLIYNTPWSRIGPFIVGVVLGYFIYVLQKTKAVVNIKSGINIFCWLIALCLCSTLVFGVYGDFNDSPLSKTAHIFYQCFSRPVWGVAVGFMIYSCITGNSGPINKILSWQAWVPLSRLTYSAYLVHQIIIIYSYATLEHPLHLQDQIMVYYFVSNLVLSYAAAFIINTCIEVPFVALEKFVFKWRS